MSRTRCPLEPLTIDGDMIVVRCAQCGEIGRLTPGDAIRIADELEGPVSRFVIAGPRDQRFELAGELRAAAA